MKRAQFLAIVQSRVARVAVGASAARSHGHAGTVQAARAFFRQLDLRQFGVPPNRFRRALDTSTVQLVRKLPKAARQWGIARKLLNIFLRDCLYTTYLSGHFRLSRAEAAYEVPLDSITAHHLKVAAGRGGLPRWPGVKHVTPELSARFQEVASVEAAKLGVPRIHLDAYWWSASRDRDKS